MNRFLQGFKDTILVFSFTGMLLVSGVPFILTFITATIVGMIVLITPEEGAKIGKILNGFKTAGIKKITYWYRKM